MQKKVCHVEWTSDSDMTGAQFCKMQRVLEVEHGDGVTAAVIRW